MLQYSKGKTMNKYDIIIVGAGASGLYCANLLSKKYKIALIEKDNKIGKKILATGNGRCNLSNLNINSHFYNNNIDKYMKIHSVNETLKVFEKLGLKTYSDNEGRIYPLSNSANSVLDILRLNIGNYVDIYLESTISNIYKEEQFIITLHSNEKLSTKYLIYACGGNSLQETQELHSSIKPFQKSLVSLQTDTNKYLNGVRVDNVCAKLNIDNKTYCEYGEILFKENAISGILIFNLSAYMARIGNYKQKIVIDFLPNFSEIELKKILEQRQKNNNKLTDSNLLTGIFHPALCRNLLEKANFDTKNCKKMAKIIKNYDIFTKNVLNNNQVYSGGIKLESLTNNLESTQTTDLFFMGECVDVDGLCGGYNLQWAWTSGYIVAKYLNEKSEI